MFSAFTYHGELAVAGLSWEQKPERLSPRQIGVRWGVSFAPVDDIQLLGQPSLLSLLLSRVPVEHCADDLIIAYADPEYDCYFGALVSEGGPINFPERVFEDLQSLSEWVLDEAQVTGSQSVAANQAVFDTLPVEIRRIPLLEPHEEFDPKSVSGQPSRLSTVSKRMLILVALGLGVLIAAGGAFYYVNATPTQAPEIVVPQTKTIYAGRDEVAYLTACGAAFLEPWSIAPGWRRDTSGCTGPNTTAATGIQAATPLAYQTYQLEAGANPTIARAAAKLVLDQSGDVISGTDKTLIVTRALDAGSAYAPPAQRPMEAQALNAPVSDVAVAIAPAFERTWEQPMQHPAPDQRLRAVEIAFLGRARSVEAVGGNAGVTAIIGEEIEVSMWGSPRDVTQILLDSPDILSWGYLSRLEERDGLVSARIGARALVPREVLIEQSEGVVRP